MRQETATEKDNTIKDNPIEKDQNGETIDGLIARLGGLGEGTQSPNLCELLVEHLEAARRERLASMRVEYALTLEQAIDSLACVPDGDDAMRSTGRCGV